MRIFNIVVLLLMLLATAANAQTTARIWGVVRSEAGKPLASVTVSLLKQSDSSLVKMDVSDAGGQFEFNDITKGQYLLSFSCIGFAKSHSINFDFTGNEVYEASPHLLVRDAPGMSTVTVQTQRPLIENKIDRMVLNVDAAPSNAGSSVLEVLEKSPGVSVDRDGIISLRGKQGVLVLMDGKQTYLSGQDLANLLRNMPASQIDQIEIMTQPSARFDASGNSGIINLKTKKNLQRGINGAINLSYQQGRYGRSPNSFQFNSRNSRVNFFSNLGHIRQANFNNQTLLRTFRNSTGMVTSVFDQLALQKTNSKNYSARFGVDYTLDKQTTIGALVTGTLRRTSWKNDGRADIFNAAGILDSFNTVRSESQDEWSNIGTNANIRRVLPNSAELTADFDFIGYRYLSKQSSNNYNYSPSGTLLGYPFWLRANLPSQIDIYSGKVDYVRNLSDDTKFEAGVKSSSVTTDNEAGFTKFDHSAQQWVKDFKRTNNFIYKERINAGYLNYSHRLNKWSVQAGLRLENTYSYGEQYGNLYQKDTIFVRNYTQLFPTLFFGYDLSDRHQFSLSYGRRIERPSYQDMNPFQYFLDQYTYRQGNPTLTPQFTHKVELSYNFNKAFTTSVSYSSTTDILNDILKQDDVTKVTYQIRENIATRKVLSLSMGFNKAVTEWWTTNIFANLNDNHYMGVIDNVPLNVKLATLSANTSQVFRFAKTWTAEMSGFYRGREQETGLFLQRPMGVVSFAFSKQLLNNKATLKMSVIDPFYIQNLDVDIRFANIDAYVRNEWDNRRVGLTFTYRFSKGQNVHPSSRRTGSSQEEQSRIQAGQ
jgi:outer membrane receptor protein involved in Fe transport